MENYCLIIRRRLYKKESNYFGGLRLADGRTDRGMCNVVPYRMDS